MKKFSILTLATCFTVALFTIAFTACDSGSSSSGSGENEITAATFDDLEACTESLEGESAYVKDEKAMYTCEGGKWTVCTDCDSSDTPSDAKKSSASKGADPDSHQGDDGKRKSDYVCEIYSLSDAQKCECNEEREDSLAYNYDSKAELVCIFDEYLNKWGWVENKKEDSDDEGEDLSSESKGESSSSAKADPCSSSVKPDSGDKNSSSGGKAESADSKSSSSSAKPDSSGDTPSSSSSKTGPAQANTSSSSYYRPYLLHLNGTLMDFGVYKTFIDDRDGREYYYMTYVGKDTSGMYDTISVMVENLNVGEMVPGTGDQSDDSKIERYCYDNDTLKCMEYGGLYQWAEMMQLPSECNTKSCADQIKPNHQGICPSGWHLLTYNDFYIVVYSMGNPDKVKGVRAGPFGGNNDSGYSLVGAGVRDRDGEFMSIAGAAYWFYPEESDQELYFSKGGMQINSSTGYGLKLYYKNYGFSVRCVMDK